ncbi:MAG: DUF4294 domain-containing protein [Saprospiraceae bacterium]|nr:DUF4294 domain-containing protein [Saprospiraceae bacterium]
MHIYCLAFLFFISLSASVFAQDSTYLIREGEYYGTTIINGEVLKVLIINGDTLPVADFETVNFTQKRKFKNRDERKRYHQWRTYAAKVYPYAAEAIRIFRKIERETEKMKKRKQKKYAKGVEKDLKPKYEKELKALTKSQGYILIKMVERELDRPFYDVISQLRGGWAAFKWQSLGRFYGYNLKSGYDAEDDPLLESILQDLNITYEDPETRAAVEASKKKNANK